MSDKKVKFAEVRITDELTHAAIADILRTGKFINGFWVQQFEDLFGECREDHHVAAVASGSAALTVTLRVFGKANAGFVIIPEYSFAATMFSVIEAGYIPIFTEVDSTGLMDIDMLRDKLNTLAPALIAAIVPVHLYGQRLELPTDILENYVVIEDAAQAHGVAFPIQGVAACFSFYPSKNLGAGGDAGAVVTSSKEAADKIRAYVNYGNGPGDSKYSHFNHGSNMRMDEIQAAILSIKLKFKTMGVEVMKRQIRAVKYASNGVDTLATVEPNALHLYPVMFRDAPAAVSRFNAAGIEVGRHYPYTLPDIYRGKNKYEPSVHATNLAKFGVSLPMGSHLEFNDIEYVNHFLSVNYDLKTFHNVNMYDWKPI